MDADAKIKIKFINGGTEERTNNFVKVIVYSIIDGCTQESEKSLYPNYFILQHMKNSYRTFYVYINIVITKILHVHFYIVSETENIHHYQISRYNTIC